MNIRKFVLSVFTVILLSCSKDENPSDISPALNGLFRIEGSNILKNDLTVQFKGVNALQTFGLVDGNLMNQWNAQIVREFIGNLNEQPIVGEAIQSSDGVWYHSLEKIVNSNRQNNKITILCPFGWMQEGQQILFTGLNPTEQIFYDEYKIKMQQIAEFFKEQPDVWIEVWNEPYHWNNENNYNHNKWLFDMSDMVDNLRKVNGFKNIVIVPGNEQGQSENAIISNGHKLIENRYNILFDLHAYEKWLLNTTEQQLISRIQTITDKKFAFIFGEIGVQNVGDVMPVQHFLNATEKTKTTTLAWLWNQNSKDNNALLTDNGLPNATVDNNMWGIRYREFLNK